MMVGMALAAAVTAGLMACQPPPRPETSPNPESSPSASPTLSLTVTSASPPPSAPVGPRYDGMLQPEDVGPGWRIAEPFRGDWPTEFLCRRAADYQAPAWNREITFRRLIMTNRPVDVPGAPGQPYEYLYVSYGQWHPEDTPAVMANSWDRMRDCQDQTMAPQTRVTIVDTGVAGDESFVVEIYVNPSLTWHSVQLRRGDVITEVIWINDRARAVELAQRAADRACEVTVC